ncbi:MAG: biotin/lipoate--protein ligase family protein [Roseinatronobacter sp.]
MSQTAASKTLAADALFLPPAFRLHHAAQPDVLAEGCAVAAEHGAGTLILHQAPRRLGFAVVLEPEAPLQEARCAFLLGMAALADALAAHCPPEKPVRLLWPDQVFFDAARLGGGRFAVTPGTAEDQIPDWMVFAADLIADRDHLSEPGRYPASTSLKEEAFDPGAQIVSTFASYMMLYFDRWAHEGYEAVANRYLMRVDPPLLRGVRRIEGTEMLEITPSGGGKRYPALVQALAAQDWYGPDGVAL